MLDGICTYEYNVVSVVNVVSKNYLYYFEHL